MAEQAAHLVDHVFPRRPVRQWVLSMPRKVRYQLARSGKLKRRVLAIFIVEIARYMRRRLGRRSGQVGGVTVVQRFGGALNLNVHFHTLMMDGLYVRGAVGEGPLFVPVPAPDSGDLARIVRRIRHRVVALLVQEGLMGDPALGEEDAPPPEPATLYEQLQAASIQGMLAFSTEPMGVGTVGRDPFAEFQSTSECLAAESDGYSLHAGVRIDGDDREGLERVCRYVLRPPFAADRFERLADGRVLYRLRRAWWDGTSGVVMDPLELLGKLAALVPSPRQHQVHYHGILAPNAIWRAAVVAECVEGGTCRKRGRGRCPMTWAELMKRTFKIDVLKCPECGGRMKLIALIGPDQPKVIQAILESMGISEEAPRRAPARGPPDSDLPWDDVA
jgi:hypothetical protein